MCKLGGIFLLFPPRQKQRRFKRFAPLFSVEISYKEWPDKKLPKILYFNQCQMSYMMKKHVRRIESSNFLAVHAFYWIQKKIELKDNCFRILLRI